MDKAEREYLWDYIDASDVLEIVDVLAGNIPLPSVATAAHVKWEEGYAEALDDVRHAATLDRAGGFRLVSTREHFEHWNGAVASTASDHGYCNAIEDMLNSIAKLIADRY